MTLKAPVGDSFVSVDPNPPPKVENKRLQRKLDLLYRRRRLLSLHYSGNVTRASLRRLAEQLTDVNERLSIKEKVTYEGLRRDYDRREAWEPLIWAAFSGVREDKKGAFEILKFLSLARMKAIALMDAADSDNARVGAIGKLTAIVETEITLLQSLGELPRVTMEPAVKVDVNVSTEQQLNFRAASEVLRTYEFLFKRRVQESNIPADRAREQVASAQASNNP